MIEAAAANGWIDRRARRRWSRCSRIRRAGADAVLTYWAIEAAGWLATDAATASPMTDRNDAAVRPRAAPSSPAG